MNPRHFIYSLSTTTGQQKGSFTDVWLNPGDSAAVMGRINDVGTGCADQADYSLKLSSPATFFA